MRTPAAVTRARPLVAGTRTIVRLLPTVSVPMTVAAALLSVVSAVSPAVGVVALLMYAAGQIWAIGTIIALVTSSAFGMLTPDIVYLRELALTAPPAKEVHVFGLGRWLEDRFTSLSRRKLDA